MYLLPISIRVVISEGIFTCFWSATLLQFRWNTVFFTPHLKFSIAFSIAAVFYDKSGSDFRPGQSDSHINTMSFRHLNNTV